MRQLKLRAAAGRVALVLALAYVVLIGGQYYGLVLFPFNALSMGLMVLGLGVWFAWRLRARPGSDARGFARTPADGAILAGLSAAGVSAVFSIDPGRSLGLVWLGLVWAGLYWAAADGLSAGLPRPRLARAIYLPGLVIVGLAVWQVVDFWMDWLTLGLLPRVAFRVAAPNPTAGVANFVWPFLAAEFIVSRRPAVRAALAGLLGLTGVAMLYTASRGGWLGMAAGAAILAWAYRRPVWDWARRALGHPVWRVAVVGGALVLGLAVIPIAARQVRHGSHSPTLAGARGPFWGAAWTAFVQSPLTGQGLFTYATAFLPLSSSPPSPMYNQAHGLIHNLMAETGLLGLAALAFGLIAFARVARLGDAWRAAALAGLGATLAHSLVETPYVNPPVMALAALTAAIVVPASGRGWRTGLLMIPVAALGVWGLWAYYPLHRGIALGDSGQWPAARRQFAEAMRRDPLSTWAKFQAAYAALRAGEPEAAIELYLAAIPAEPGYSLNWANLGAAQWAAGDTAGALASLAHARALAPSADPLEYAERVWRGERPSASPSETERLEARIAQLAAGRIDASLLDADRERLAAAFAGGQANAAQAIQLAEIELARDDLARAEYLLAYAAATREASPRALHFAYGDLAAARGDLPAAVAWYERAWRAYPPPEEYGLSTNYAWLVFVRASLRGNLAPELRTPPLPLDMLERMRTLAEWHARLGQVEAARAVDAWVAEWDR